MHYIDDLLPYYEPLCSYWARGQVFHSRENRCLKFQYISYFWRRHDQEHDDGYFNYSKVFWGADLYLYCNIILLHLPMAIFSRKSDILVI